MHHIRTKQPLNTWKNIFVPDHHARPLYIEIYGFPYPVTVLQEKDNTSLLLPFPQLLHNVLCHTGIPVRGCAVSCQFPLKSFGVYIFLYCLWHTTYCNVLSVIIHHLRMNCFRHNRFRTQITTEIFYHIPGYSHSPQKLFKINPIHFSNNQHIQLDKKRHVCNRFPRSEPDTITSYLLSIAQNLSDVTAS